MPTTLKIPSFSDNNIRERTELRTGIPANTIILPVRSTEGYVVGDILYVGALGREACEKAVIQAITAPDALTLVSETKHPHTAFEPVTSVHADLIRIYRAVNVNDQIPSIETFSVLATRNIDSDQPSSYYTDSSGDSTFWYRFTYFNQTTLAETDIRESIPVRGDDFGHYASISDIRREAGFENATNLSDVDVDAKRRMAESEINAALANHYTVPFKPVPEIIQTLTIKLAAAHLKYTAYGDDRALKDARAQLTAHAAGSGSITDGTGTDLSTSEGVTFDFGTEPRMFTTGQRF